jgi:hypothetical protein
MQPRAAAARASSAVTTSAVEYWYPALRSHTTITAGRPMSTSNGSQ